MWQENQSVSKESQDRGGQHSFLTLAASVKIYLTLGMVWIHPDSTDT